MFDIYSSLKTNDAKVELWTSGGTNNQKFTIKYIGNGCYTISPVHSGKLIDVANNSKNREHEFYNMNIMVEITKSGL